MVNCCSWQRIIREHEYPPIINMASRTLAAPLKEQKFYRTPSQTIGNNYSPHVQHLRVKGLHQQLRALHKQGLPASFCTEPLIVAIGGKK